MKKRLISILLVVVMVLAMLPTAFAAEEAEPGPIGENLITNGSFEELDANGHPVGVVANGGDKTFGGTNGTHTVVTDADKVYDGSNAVYIYDLTGQTSRLVVSTPAVEAGKTYQFSYWAKGNTYRPSGNGLYAELGAALDYQSDGVGFVDIPAEDRLVLDGDGEWYQLTCVFEAAETGPLSFYIGVGWAPWIAAVDAVALYEYGIPAEDVPADDAAAKIGEIYYATLAEAVAAVPEGETIVLLKDNDETGIVINKETFFFIDGNAFGYDIANNLHAGPCLSRHASGSPYEEYLAVFQYDYSHNYTYTSNGDNTHDAVCDCEGAPIDNEGCSFVEGVCEHCSGAETEPDPTPGTILTAATDPEAVDNKNYLLNEGDFETANPFNMILSERTDADAYEGDYSVKMSTKSTELKSQFKVIANMLDNPGKLYRLSFMVKGKAEGKLMVTYSNWTNANGLINVVEKEIGTVDTADWTQLTYTVRVPDNIGGTTGGGSEITFHFTGLGTLYVDNVEFYQVVETAAEGAGGNANLGNGAEPEAPYVPEEPEDPDDGFLSYTRDSVDGKNYLDPGEGDFEAFVVPNNLKNAQRQSDVTYRGSYAMKMLVTEDMDISAQRAQFMVVANRLNPGKIYNLTMMVKGSISGKLMAAMNNYNNNNGHIGLEEYEIGTVNSPDEWTQLVLTVKMPDNVGGTTGGGSEINLYFQGTGELYVDNVEFYQVWASWKYESLDNKNYLDAGEGDFEAGVTSQNLLNAAVQSDVVFEGQKAIKMTADEGGKAQFLVIANKLNPGKIYNLALMVKGSTTGSLMAALNHWDNSNAFLKAETLDLGVVDSADGWSQIVYKLKVPDLVGGTTGGGTEINIYFEGAGELYVDDVQFYYVADVEENTNPEVGPTDSVDGKELLGGLGDFETLGEDGMPVGFWYYNDEATDMLRGHIPTLNTDADFVHGGSNSVKLLSEKGGLSGMQSDFFIPAIPGATYTMAYWGKGELGVGEGAARGIIGAGATFYRTNVEFEDEEEEKANIVGGTDPGAAGAIHPNPFGWTYFRWSFTAPDGAAYMKVSIPIPWDSGYVCIDDWVLYCTELPVSEPIDDKQCATNGGFEEVVDGVPAGLAEPALAGGEMENTLNAYAEETEKVTGNYALKLATDEAGDARVHVAAKDLVPSATYRVTFKYKGSLSTDLSVDLELYNRNEFIWDTYIKDADFADVTPTDEWQLYTGFFTLPLNGAAALLELSYTGATGAVYVDDVEIYMVGGPDLATMVPELIYCYPDLDQSHTELRFFSGYNAAENYTVNFKLMDGETVLQSVTDAEIVDHVATFNYDLTAEMKAASKAQWDLWLADHSVQQDHPFAVVAEVLNQDGSLRATYTDYIYIYERPTLINEDGQYVDSLTGEVFDAVIAYGIRRFTEFNSDEEVKAYLQTMKDGGVNTIMWQFNYDEQGGYQRDLKDLQILYEMGMKAEAICYWGMYPAGNEHNTEQVPARIKQILENGTPEQLSAIYAWCTADEPFAHEDDSNEVRKDMINGYKVLRALDPRFPISYVEADYRFYEQAASFADIVEIDPYPGRLDYNTWVGDRSTFAREEVHESRNINNIMQAITYDTVRPTGQQMHSMIYQAYLADSNSISYYTMEWAHDVLLWESTDLWPAMVAFHTDEDHIMNAQYSSGSETFVKRDRSEDAWYDVWTAADGTTYVAVQNRLHETNVVDVEVSGVTAASFVTKYNADLAAIAVTESGLDVTLTDGQAVLVKISAETEEPAPELAIVTHPVSYEGNVGDTVTFTVEATGEELTYQWYYLAVGGEAWQKSYSTGATTDTLTVELRAYRDGQAYYCVVTDANGDQVASNAVIMKIRAGEFTIKEHPAAYEGAEGDTATFTVVAEGDNLSYRWEYSNDGGQTWQNSWSDGYATDTLTVQLLAYRNGQQYRCVVSNPKGEQIISNAAVLSLKACEIEIVAQPESATVAAGETVTFTVEAEGENLKYRWYRSNDGGETWTETWLSGYNTNELSFVVNAARAATPYKCVITSGSTTVETDPVTVTIG